jgi:hypothetical protein
MQRLCACAALASALVGGCSATAVPIAEPEHVTALSTDLAQSELEAIAWSIRDVVDVAVKSLLRAPPGAVSQQLTSTGTLAFQGTASQPGDAAETLTLTLALDGYEPKVHAAVSYTDFRLFAGTPALTLDFTNEPLATNDDIGNIGGTFEGAVGLARAKGAGGLETVDARLAIRGQLARDANDKIVWQVLHISGVIYSPTFDEYYYNDASIPYANQ